MLAFVVVLKACQSLHGLRARDRGTLRRREMPDRVASGLRPEIACHRSGTMIGGGGAG
jgi:hypothetical protein